MKLAQESAHSVLESNDSSTDSIADTATIGLWIMNNDKIVTYKIKSVSHRKLRFKEGDRDDGTSIDHRVVGLV